LRVDGGVSPLGPEMGKEIPMVTTSDPGPIRMGQAGLVGNGEYGPWEMGPRIKTRVIVG